VGPFLIATGVALIPILALGVALLATVERGRRREAARHPVRAIGDALRSNND
jgi:hypothetical protein